MKNSKLITSKEILNVIGRKSSKTLTRWHKHYDLIPAPIIKTHPSGRGKMAYWDKKYLGLFKLINEMFNEGATVKEIRCFINQPQQFKPFNNNDFLKELQKIKDKFYNSLIANRITENEYQRKILNIIYELDLNNDAILQIFNLWKQKKNRRLDSLEEIQRFSKTFGNNET